MSLTRQFLLCLIVGLSFLSTLNAFAPMPSAGVRLSTSTTTFRSNSSTQREAFVPTSSLEVAATTFDPAAALSDVLGGFLGSPAVLAVPILAALGVAGLVAFFIVSYANPVVEDDEY